MKRKNYLSIEIKCVCGKKQTVDIVHISFMIWLFACHQIYQVLLLDALFWSKFSLYLVVEKANGPPVHFGSVCELTIDGYWVGWEKIFSITCNACMMFRLVLIHHSTCEYLPFPYTSLQYFRVHLAKRSS